MNIQRWKRGRGVCLLAAVAVGAALTVTSMTWGQTEAETSPPPAEAPAGEMAAPAMDPNELAKLWDNFLHGIKVARAELAESTGRAILESGQARQLYLLSVEEEDLEWLLARGEGLAGLKPVIEDIREMIEAGYTAERSDPERIAHAIDLLDENLRAYEVGSRRLVQSGEFAMPQLVQKLMDDDTPATLTERIISVLPRMGKGAVRPLAAALQADDQALLQTAAGVLGRIRYGEAAAALKVMLEREDLVDRTRDIATTALVSCGGEAALTTPVASVLYDQAEKYYYNRQSVPLDPNAPTANVWSWREGLGLECVIVPKEIFGDIYAMRLCRKALEHDASFHPAVSLWLAAKMRKEIRLPAGQSDPTVSTDDPGARFYALAASAEYLQDVLSRALRDDDPALALQAIAPLAETAGAQSLVHSAEGGIPPLVEALGNRDQEVRVLAALALANALPREPFKDSERVVVVLNEALRQRGHRKALLIDADPTRRNLLKDALRAGGYDVVDEPDPDKALLTGRKTGGIDLVVLGARPHPANFLLRMRAEPTMAALPAVVTASDERLRRLAREDPATVLIETEIDAANVAEALDQAVKAASAEPETQERTASWAVRAAEAIALLGQTRNPVYDISKTADLLTSALGDEQEDVATAAAEALAAMGTPQAQQALVDRALTEAVAPKTRIELLRLLAGSLRRFGNLLTDSQASAIVAVVVDAEQPATLRQAAARVLGAMNLPSEKIRALIVGS